MRRLAFVMTTMLVASTVHAKDEKPISDTPNDESAAIWQKWPTGAPHCSQDLIDNYIDGWSVVKFDALYHLSICAHTKAADFEDIGYAVSQLGGTKRDATTSIVRFSERVRDNMKAWEFCISSAGVQTKDSDGAWKSIGSVMSEFVRRVEKSDPKCLDILK